MSNSLEPIRLAGSVLNSSRHGILQENAFYAPPDAMLKKLKERAAD